MFVFKQVQLAEELLAAGKKYLIKCCKFLIKSEELVNAYNCRKHFLQILKSCYYFADCFEFMKTLNNICWTFFNFIFLQFDTKQQNCKIKYSNEIRNIQYITSNLIFCICGCILQFQRLLPKKTSCPSCISKVNRFFILEWVLIYTGRFSTGVFWCTNVEKRKLFH